LILTFIETKGIKFTVISKTCLNQCLNTTFSKDFRQFETLRVDSPQTHLKIKISKL